MHRPTWAGCTGIRVSRSSQSGLPHSSIPMYELPTGRCARIISCRLRPQTSRNLGYPLPVIPRHLHRRAGDPFYQASPRASWVAPTNTCHRRGVAPLMPPLRWTGGLVVGDDDNDPIRKKGGARMQVQARRKVQESGRGQGAGTIYNRRTSCLRLPSGLLALEAQRENSARAREGGR